MLGCWVPAIFLRTILLAAMFLPALEAQTTSPREKVAPVKTSITVTEHISAETPANITVMDQTEIEETPGTEMDDRLRQIPGFSLFRRTSSLVANPTTQGVSLRGLGSSGASRSLVLWDGVPVNDSFGSWVYWSRFSPDEIGQVEVVRGAATSIFGDRAMGGSISLFSRPAEKDHLETGLELGNRNTDDAWLGFSDLWSHWAFSAHGHALTTDGYYIVPETYNGARVRGSADTPAGVRYVTGDIRLDWLGGANQVFFKSDMLVESRQNGTTLTTNATSLGEVAGHYQRDLGQDAISVLGFYNREGFHATFSSVPANRNSETLSFVQTVPSDSGGGSALWQHHRSRFDLIAGADFYRTEGVSTDSFPTTKRVGGGVILEHGIFGQSDLTAGPFKFFAGARHTFTGLGGTYFSPSAGIVAGRSHWRARGTVYRSFRAPTLNELYRNFQVGNTLTEANAGLVPETVFGAEAGLDFVGESTNVRMTFFRNSLQDLVTNVTLRSAPNSIVRQRQNAAAALSRGGELNAQRRWKSWRGEIGYLFADSAYNNGKRIPEVPRHQGSAMLSFEQGRTMASFGVRAYGLQFDDDLNTYLLPGFATLEMMASERLGKGFSANVSFENLLDRQYLVAFTPTPNIGEPRLWRVGILWSRR